MIKRILVTGSNGQLGKCLEAISKNYEKLDFIFTSRDQLDITDENVIKKYFELNQFDAVVNCAAYTAVDNAESDFENAFLINATAVKFLAQQTALKNIPFVHISTDYVFDGTSSIPYSETDEVNPIGVYGKTKLEGEKQALQANSKTIIIRTSWVYSEYGNNFVKTMLRLFNEREEISVINDQIGSPTNALDLADAIAQILLKDELVYGIFNYSNEGTCSWFNFASAIKEIVHSGIHINSIPTSAYPTLAKRPTYSLLNKNKIKKIYNLDIPNWKLSLEKFLNSLPK